ncbi:MAG: EamA family transporter [Planctomycetota bacterium]
MSYLGEIAALGTALCWLGSSLAFAYAGRAVGAQPLNQFRLYAALPLLCLLAWLLLGSAWPADASGERQLWLAISGVVGLVLGDFCFFYALATIGPRVSSVVMSLWPGCAVGFELLRGNRSTSSELLGITMTIVGVVLVLLRRRSDGASGAGGWRSDLSRRQWTLGILGALGGALGQAFGFLVSGDAMAAVPDPSGGPDFAPEIDPLLATIVRMVAATIGMQLVVTLQGQPLAMAKVVRNRRAHAMAWVGAICGPVLGVWLSMVARARAEHAGVAAALMATTPVFLLPVSIYLYRARVGPLGIFGTLLAVAGVVVCVVG